MAEEGQILPPEVTQAQQQAQSASRLAGEFSSRAFTIPDELRRTINETLKANEPLFQRRAETLSGFLAAPQVGEARFGVETSPEFIFNPFERGKAVAQFVSGQEIPFLTVNALLGQVVGGGERLIQAGTRAFQAASASRQAEAQQAQQGASFALQNFIAQENARIQREQLKIEQQREARLSRGSTTDKHTVNLPGFGPIDLSSSELLSVWKEMNNQPDLSNKAKTDLAKYKSLIDDMTKIGNSLGEQRQGVFGLTTGPLAQFGGQVLGGADIRTAISDFASDVQHEKYGGALTGEEIKQARTWVPSKARQEGVNITRLNRQIDKKTNQLSDLMRVEGFNQDQINQFLQTGQPPSLGGFGGFNLLNAGEFEEIF